MSEFHPLHEQEAKPLFEKPLLNVQLGDNFSTEQIGKSRRKIINFLRLNPDQDPELDPKQVEELLKRVGYPIPDSTLEDIELVLGELLSNAERPEAGRRATGVYVWASEHRVGIGVGDNSDTIAGKDERPQTELLSSELGAAAFKAAYDPTYSVGNLESSGLGGNLTSMLATGGVAYSLIPKEAADHEEEPRTHKVIRADFNIEFASVQDQAA